MDPITLSAIIGGGSSLLNAASSLFTNSANKKNALEFYNRQRTDALADWNMQNQYNSPKAQMARFKEAGLSPHLIYGQTNTAPAVRSSQSDTPKYVAPQLDNSLTSLPMMAIQMENLQKQGKLIDAQVLKTNSDTDWRNVNTEFLKDTMPYRMEALNVSNLLKGSQYRKTEEEITKTQGQIRLQKQQAANIIANTNLTNEKKAQVSQMIQNLITTNALIGEKVKSEQYLNEIQQKLQSVGIVGNTLAQILRLFK